MLPDKLRSQGEYENNIKDFHALDGMRILAQLLRQGATLQDVNLERFKDILAEGQWNM